MPADQPWDYDGFTGQVDLDDFGPLQSAAGHSRSRTVSEDIDEADWLARPLVRSSSPDLTWTRSRNVGPASRFLFTTPLGWQLYVAFLAMALAAAELGTMLLHRLVLFTYPVTLTFYQLLAIHVFLLFLASFTRLCRPIFSCIGLAGLAAPSRVKPFRPFQPLHVLPWWANSILQLVYPLRASWDGIAGGGPGELDLAVIKHILPLVIVFVAKVALGNVALAFSAVPKFTLAHIHALPLTLGFTYVLQKTSLSLATLSSSLIATLNLLIASVQSGGPAPRDAIVASVISGILDGLFPVLLVNAYQYLLREAIAEQEHPSARRSRDSYDPHSNYQAHFAEQPTGLVHWRLLHYISLLSPVVLFPILVLTGEIKDMQENCYVLDTKRFWNPAIGAFFCTLASFILTPLFTAATGATVTGFWPVPRQALQLAVTNPNMPVHSWVGVALCWLSSIWFVAVRWVTPPPDKILCCKLANESALTYVPRGATGLTSSDSVHNLSGSFFPFGGTASPRSVPGARSPSHVHPRYPEKRKLCGEKPPVRNGRIAARDWFMPWAFGQMHSAQRSMLRPRFAGSKRPVIKMKITELKEFARTEYAGDLWQQTRAASTVDFKYLEGFAYGVTGGGNAAPVYPSTIQELASYLGDSQPRNIVISKTFNFINSEGRVSSSNNGCRPSSNTCPCTSSHPTGCGQDAINANNWCDPSYPKLTLTYDKAGVQGITITSNKSLIGDGAAAVIRGKGLRIANGAKNVIVQNVAITELNPQYIWGGDAITLDNTDLVWIDHVTVSLTGRQQLVLGNGPSNRVSVTNNVFDGRTSWSASCDGDHYWTIYLTGSSDKVTLKNNYIHNTSGRGPKIAQNTLVHAVNNYWSNLSGHAFDASSSGAVVLAEGNVFEDVDTPLLAGGNGPVYVAYSSNVGQCQSALGRECVPNSLSNSGAFNGVNAADVMTAFKNSGTIASAKAVGRVRDSVVANSGAGNV
ncbi:hypothetical protein FH972_001642 [Carpinus fangiana]|uniref:pectin lyase n=1 Tax=Carpinus fangiana TaxID=176857 RepID=A0A5N6QCI5_9ROSI|nr:hypothetical protein FH972_001642 [Carpinus fangiana]